VSAALDDGVCFAVTLDPAEQPFLGDHRIDGTPVLPGVMGIEAFVESACALAPGWQVKAVEDVAFLAPVKCYRDAARTVEVAARLELHGENLVARCRLDGRRMLTGQPEQVTRHFQGTVVLSPDPPAPATAQPPARSRGPVVSPDAIYRLYFHGPAYQVLAGAWSGGDGTAVGGFALDLPPDHDPDGAPFAATPRLVELCFQTAGLHELATTGRLALPARVARIEWPAAPGPVGAVCAVVTAHDDGADAVVVTASGDVVVRLFGYATTPLPAGAPEDALRPLRDALT
jgi:hypothetical protein